MHFRPSGRRALVSAAALTLLVCPAIARAELPLLDRDKPFQCLTDGSDRQWRVQCAPDDAPADARFCLYAPDAERDEDGAWVKPLERARGCWSSGPFDVNALKAKGFRLVEAVADAPFGWYRDERGRVFQASFDLHRRLWIGVHWWPGREEGDLDSDPAKWTRFGVDFGLLEYTHFSGGYGKTKVRHRLSLVEGNVTVAPFGARIVAFHYDASLRYKTPLLRLTTFFGKPRRYDGRLNLGFWAEGGDLEIHKTPAGDEHLWRYFTFHLTADLWQSADLYSFVRVRGGVGFEEAFAATGPDRGALTPGAALDVDLTLDAEGKHHVVGEAVYEAPVHLDTYPLVGDRSKRFRGELAYEHILFALNDQPFSVRAAAGASWRDDIPGVLDPGWEYHATVGLRFSLWAPAREPPVR